MIWFKFTNTSGEPVFAYESSDDVKLDLTTYLYSFTEPKACYDNDFTYNCFSYQFKGDNDFGFGFSLIGIGKTEETVAEGSLRNIRSVWSLTQATTTEGTTSTFEIGWNTWELTSDEEEEAEAEAEAEVDEEKFIEKKAVQVAIGVALSVTTVAVLLFIL